MRLVTGLQLVRITLLAIGVGLGVAPVEAQLKLACSANPLPAKLSTNGTYNMPCDASGGIGFYGFAIVSGPLPPGLNYSVGPSQINIAGTPPVTGSYSFIPERHRRSPGYLGYFKTWPSGHSEPVVSTLNSYSGALAANAAIVPAGTGGAIQPACDRQRRFPARGQRLLRPLTLVVNLSCKVC
jgi:hypothetical protein